MRLSPAGYAFLREFEQFRPTAYRPHPDDVWTIGWGHTAGVKEGDTCTLTQAEVWLHEDTAAAEKDASDHVEVPLNQAQFDAFVSIVFNAGPGRVAHGNDPGRDGIIRLASGQPSTLLRLLNAGDYAGAAAEFPRWRKSGGRVMAGLVRRRGRERKIFTKGDYNGTSSDDIPIS